jgi:hypothetical protein
MHAHPPALMTHAFAYMHACTARRSPDGGDGMRGRTVSYMYVWTKGVVGARTCWLLLLRSRGGGGRRGEG